MNEFKFIEELEDLSIQHATHIERLGTVIDRLNVDQENVRLLHQIVQQTLAYHGFDTQMEEFTAEHNRVMNKFFNTLGNMKETLQALAIDYVNLTRLNADYEHSFVSLKDEREE